MTILTNNRNFKPKAITLDQQLTKVAFSSLTDWLGATNGNRQRRQELHALNPSCCATCSTSSGALTFGQVLAELEYL